MFDRSDFQGRSGPRTGGRGGGRHARAALRAMMSGGFGGGWEDAGGPGGRGGRGGRGGPGSGRRGRGRLFDGGELRLVLLKLIGEGPRHGYDLIRAIEELTGGAYAPSPGVVYPTLTLLAEMDLIADSESEGARKLYAITQAGEAHLAERADEVSGLLARLASLGAEQQRSNSGPVRRAMGNLKMALMGRLREGEANDELPHEIAAILDEAARKIERL